MFLFALGIFILCPVKVNILYVTVSRIGILDEYSIASLPSHPTSVLFSPDESSLYVLCNSDYTVEQKTFIPPSSSLANNFLVKCEVPDISRQKLVRLNEKFVIDMSLSSSGNELVVLAYNAFDRAVLSLYSTETLKEESKKEYEVTYKTERIKLEQINEAQNYPMQVLFFDDQWLFSYVSNEFPPRYKLTVLSLDFDKTKSYTFPSTDVIVFRITPLQDKQLLALTNRGIFIWQYDENTIVPACTEQYHISFFQQPIKASGENIVKDIIPASIGWAEKSSEEKNKIISFRSNKELAEANSILSYNCMIAKYRLSLYQTGNIAVLSCNDYSGSTYVEIIDMRKNNAEQRFTTRIGAFNIGHAGLLFWTKPIAVSAQNKYMATGHCTNSLILWDINNGDGEKQKWKYDAIKSAPRIIIEFINFDLKSAEVVYHDEEGIGIAGRNHYLYSYYNYFWHRYCNKPVNERTLNVFPEKR